MSEQARSVSYKFPSELVSLSTPIPTVPERERLLAELQADLLDLDLTAERRWTPGKLATALVDMGWTRPPAPTWRDYSDAARAQSAPAVHGAVPSDRLQPSRALGWLLALLAGVVSGALGALTVALVHGVWPR